MAFCIIQPEHPQHGEYLQSLARRQISAAQTFVPTEHIAGWFRDEDGDWVNANDHDDIVRFAGGVLSTHTSGTYGEGGGTDVPFAVLEAVLRSAGLRIVPVE
jgi:hypothetical protein